MRFIRKNVKVETSAGRHFSDAGSPVVREFHERIGWTAQFAAALNDESRDRDHSIPPIVRRRVYGIIAGDEDRN
ncbi:MAG: transposase, partial [Planctomycetaceae bacterium]